MNDNFKSILNNSAAAGLLYSGLTIVFYFLGINPMGAFSWLLVPIQVYMLYKGIKDYRDNFNGGEITYGKAFRTGVTLGFFYASFCGLILYLFGAILAKDLVEIQKAEVLKGLEEAQKFFDNTDFIDKAIEEMDKMSLGSLAWGDFQNKLFGSAFLSLILSAFLKKEKPLFDSPNTNE
jgi:hypothetical protein